MTMTTTNTIETTTSTLKDRTMTMNNTNTTTSQSLAHLSSAYKNDTRFEAIIAEQHRRLLLVREEKTASEWCNDYSGLSKSENGYKEFCFESGSTYTFKMGRYGQEVEVHIMRRTAKFIYFKHPVTGVTTRRKVKKKKAQIDSGLGIRSDNTFHVVVMQKAYEYIEASGSRRADDMRCDSLFSLSRADWNALMDIAIEEGVEFAKTLPAPGIYA